MDPKDTAFLISNQIPKLDQQKLNRGFLQIHCGSNLDNSLAHIQHTMHIVKLNEIVKESPILQNCPSIVLETISDTDTCLILPCTSNTAEAHKLISSSKVN
jgi:hypothetical protein